MQPPPRAVVKHCPLPPPGHHNQNIYSALNPSTAPVAKQGKKKRIQFKFESPPPEKPLPIPTLNFDKDTYNLPKLASYSTSKFDETRYSTERCKFLFSVQPKYERKVRVASWNLLMKSWEKKLNPNHPAYDASQLWCNRVKLIAAAINDMQPHILGVQELYELDGYNQEDDLYNYIGTAYERYSTKGDDGEHNTIFLKRNTFKVIQAQTLRSADKSFSFMIVIYKNRKLGIINGHFSFETNARETQARFIRAVAKEHEDKEMIVMLDANITPNNPCNVQTKAGWDGPYIESLLEDGNLIQDAYKQSLFGHVGSLGTFTNDEHNAERFKGLGSPGVRLDRILVTPKKIMVFMHGIFPFISEEKKYPSDHQAVVADLYIEEGDVKPPKPPITIQKKPAAAAPRKR